MPNQLAIIRNPKLAIEDHSGEICLFFDALINESGGALQVIHWSHIELILRTAQVFDISKLDGKSCWVNADMPGIIQFIRMANI